MQLSSVLWIVNMNVALFLSMPAMAHVLNASLELSTGGYTGIKPSIGKLHRCTSLSSDVCNEAAVSELTKRRNPTTYNAAHSKLSNDHREHNSLADRRRSEPPKLRRTRKLDGECSGIEEPCMYTRIQTQLYPHIRF